MEIFSALARMFGGKRPNPRTASVKAAGGDKLDPADIPASAWDGFWIVACPNFCKMPGMAGWVGLPKDKKLAPGMELSLPCFVCGSKQVVLRRPPIAKRLR